MHEPQVVQLFQPRDYLKQDVIQLAVVAVLLEVRPEIHFVPLNLDQEGIAREEVVLVMIYVLALLPRCLVQNKNLVVELLSQHKVCLEAIVGPEAMHHVRAHFRGDRPNDALLDHALTYPL